MDAVIKVGGSLSETPVALKALGVELCRLAKKYRIAVVPGGGKFADAVRDLDAKFGLPLAVSHRMAILAMDQYGLLLSQVINEARNCNSLAEAKKISGNGHAAVFLPSKLMEQANPFEPSWEVTSDSVSAYIAVKLKAAKAVFITDVDGVFTRDPKTHADAELLAALSVRELLGFGNRTSVDTFLPKFLAKNPLDCYVVNGLHPERVKVILSGRKSVYTRITPDKP
jgi:5-(aminomethyl)-3-furanmethanol phosphate kinase